jgi:hypothetical protein
LSQEQVPSLHIQHLPNRLRFTLQQKIALAAQLDIIHEAKYYLQVYISSTRIDLIHKARYHPRG